VFYIEPYGLSASSASLLSRFVERYSLALEIEPCLRKNAPAIAVRIESQGGSLKLPKLTILRQEELWSRGLWEWELPPEWSPPSAQRLGIKAVRAGRPRLTTALNVLLAGGRPRMSRRAQRAGGLAVQATRLATVRICRERSRPPWHGPKLVASKELQPIDVGLVRKGSYSEKY
jgi:hypothetical protein